MELQNDRQSDLLSALYYLDPDVLDYEEWLHVGMALLTEGLQSEYDPWSQRGTQNKYVPGEPEKKLKTFTNGKFTGDFIFKLAQERGWINPKKGIKPTDTKSSPGMKNGHSMKPEVKQDHPKQDVQIMRLKKILKLHNTKTVNIVEPSEDWDAKYIADSLGRMVNHD